MPVSWKPCRRRRSAGGVPSLGDVERCVDMGSLMFKRYGDGLVKNIMGFGNPAADIEAIEG